MLLPEGPVKIQRIGSGGSSAISGVNANDNEPLVSAKVIDGYIQGANVYIDFNWNLQQDEGEPSAVDNGNGDYEFPYKNGEFDAIDDVVLPALSDGYKWPKCQSGL